MKAYAIRLAVLLLWVGMMFILLRFEAYPEWFTNSLQGYRGLVSRELLMRDNWSRILIGGVPAGYGYTSIGVDEESVDKAIEIDNRTRLRVSILGKIHNFHMRTTLRLGPSFRLRRFESNMSSRDYTFSLEGQRLEDEEFEIVVKIGGHEQRTRLNIPDDAVLFLPLNEMAIRTLKPGQQLVVKTIDPLTMEAARIRLSAVGTETIEVDGVMHEAVRVEADVQGKTLTSWVGQDGLILRQETVMGWVIEACSSETAAETVMDDAPAPDLLTDGGGAALLRMLNTSMKGVSP